VLAAHLGGEDAAVLRASAASLRAAQPAPQHFYADISTPAAPPAMPLPLPPRPGTSHGRGRALDAMARPAPGGGAIQTPCSMLHP
jgi:hypothetical protein